MKIIIIIIIIIITIIIIIIIIINEFLRTELINFVGLNLKGKTKNYLGLGLTRYRLRATYDWTAVTQLR